MSRPKPPADLWQRMEAMRESLRVVDTPPEGSIDAKAYAEHFNVGVGRASFQLNKLTSQGKMKMIGRFNRANYYMPVN